MDLLNQSTWNVYIKFTKWAQLSVRESLTEPGMQHSGNTEDAFDPISIWFFYDEVDTELMCRLQRPAISQTDTFGYKNIL